MKTIGKLLLAGCASLFAVQHSGRAEFLYNSYLVPGFSTNYSEWDVFYTPYSAAGQGENYPDIAAPYGTFGAVPSPPDNSNPSNPFAYAHASNPTIAQIADPNAFIIGPATTGNIYSFSGATGYRLTDPSTNPVGTVIFQFQTEGTAFDFSAIQLSYTNGSGTHFLSANELIREYRSSGSAFGGLGTRAALQWNLAGLGVTSYEIHFESPGSSNSFQNAILDTAATYTKLVPSSGNWTGGSGNWSNTGNWAVNGTNGNRLPDTNGNATFSNSANINVNVDSVRTIGELIFDSGNNVTLSGSALTVNTGITTTDAVGSGNQYTINNSYAMGALNLFDIQNGAVTINGVVSGAYGFVKTGNGTLSLNNNNTFTGSVGVEGGTLRLGGSNTYTGPTTVLFGKLILAANAPSGSAGALGNATSAVTLGASSSTFSSTGDTSAHLIIEGDRTVGRGVALAFGTFEKHLTATGTTTGATFSGAINFGATTAAYANNVHLNATNANDRLTFSGAMTGGTVANTVTKGGLGTVVFSGPAKTYGNSTTVANGTLHLASGSGYSGNGNVTVNSGANLRVDGTLGGTGTFTLNGRLSGTGTVNRSFTIGNGAQIAPGNSVGTLSTSGETWAGGGDYLWEVQSTSAGEGTGWDFLNITGALSITASAGNEFTIDLGSLTTLGADGELNGFDQSEDYSWRIATASGGITGFDSGKFLIDTADFLNDHSGLFEITQTGNHLYLTYTAIPEPSVPLLVLAGAAALYFKRRRQTS